MFTEKQTDKMEDLFKRIVDSHDGYRDAAQETENIQHKNLFTERMNTRFKYATSLREHLKTAGEDVDFDGTVLADAHRMFMKLKDMVMRNDEGLLDAVEEGEEALIEEYEETIACLNDQPLVKTELNKQLQDVKNGLGLIERMEDAA